KRHGGVQMPQSKLETPCHLLYILKQTKRTRKKTTKKKPPKTNPSALKKKKKKSSFD
ncbi:unnamed protein product, partial [Coccothraustes coccothraustes]